MTLHDDSGSQWQEARKTRPELHGQTLRAARAGGSQNSRTLAAGHIAAGWSDGRFGRS